MSREKKNTPDREILLSREFDVPRKQVFDAWTEPDKIGKWWGPNGFTTTTKNMNFEVGGDWIFTMLGPDGTGYPNHIIYTKIKEPERIEYDHYGHKDEEGDPPHFKTTVVFEDRGERTKLKMRMLFPTAEKRKEVAEFGAVEGGKQTLNRLASFFDGIVFFEPIQPFFITSEHRNYMSLFHEMSGNTTKHACSAYDEYVFQNHKVIFGY